MEWSPRKQAFKDFVKRNLNRVVSAPKKAFASARSFLQRKWQQLKAWYKETNFKLAAKVAAAVVLLSAVLYYYVLTAYGLLAFWSIYLGFVALAATWAEFVSHLRKRREARETLGVDINATPEEIRAAWMSKVKTWHPDTVASKDTIRDYELLGKEQTQRLNNAYATLIPEAA